VLSHEAVTGLCSGSRKKGERSNSEGERSNFEGERSTVARERSKEREGRCRIGSISFQIMKKHRTNPMA